MGCTSTFERGARVIGYGRLFKAEGIVAHQLSPCRLGTIHSIRKRWKTLRCAERVPRGGFNNEADLAQGE
jgi:hypothetical protein